MMLGLPKSTELSKQLPKKAIYTKFSMNTSTKEKFDTDISKISIIAEISPSTTNIVKGETVSSIFVLLVSLKQKDFDEKTISMLSKLIEQNILFVLEYEDKRKLAVYHNKLMQGEWVNSTELAVSLKGLNFDTVWENLIKDIGSITLSNGNTLDEQITVNEQKEKLQKEIARLEKQARTERQPKKKLEFVEQKKLIERHLKELE